MLALEWRPRARLDRESIAIYLGVECGMPETALKVIREIDEAIDRVREFPESGRPVRIEDLDNKDYRVVPAGRYRVYYRSDETTLTVYRIIHQKRDIDDYALFDLREHFI